MDERLLKTGDIASARLYVARAADAGYGRAALMMDQTFDPAYPAEAGGFGISGDPCQAELWHRRAGELGETEGGRRSDELARKQRAQWVVWDEHPTVAAARQG